jgi:hypothetical protein
MVSLSNHFGLYDRIRRLAAGQRPLGAIELREHVKALNHTPKHSVLAV